ncbi:MAG: hypothetical protein ACKPHU_29955, partial [Planctomycetaceae bacterium]
GLLPAADSPDAAVLTTLSDSRQPTPLSLDFRMLRAIRVISVTRASVQAALQTTDNAAQRIRACQQQEHRSGHILSAWERNNNSHVACANCRAKTWCPEFKGQ